LILHIILFSGDFLLKHQMHSIPITTTNGHRPMVIVPPTSSYRIPSINGRHRDSDNERQMSCVLNDKSIRTNHHDTKYDNYGRFRSGSETVTLVLQRDKRVLDFGFSISDRLYGTGVYVNKIRPNGPAELEGTLIPCMRIYQVCSEEKRQ
jgi:hypothetical protein